MLLPAIQYGDWKTVKGRMRKLVAQLKRRDDLVELMTADGMVDVADRAGLIVMVRSTLGSAANFHCFAPWREAWEAMFDIRVDPPPEPVVDAIFAASLKAPWGLLGLLSSDNQPWLIPRERHQPFLHAVLDAWPDIDSVGSRYFVVGQGQPLWTIPNNLHYVLANMGVPNDVLRAPLPPEGPSGLLRYARTQG